jgi:predicted Zn finger-like uncharacterized protein
MSLATRCTACGTVFRLVPDQLKVSGGWVRCGRCNEVFNAADALVDADAGAGAPDAHRQRVQEDLARLDAPEPALEDGPAAPAVPVDAQRSEPTVPPAPVSADASAALETIEAPAAAESAEAAEAAHATEHAEGAPAAPAADDLRADLRPERAAADPKPGFVRAAERAARW